MLHVTDFVPHIAAVGTIEVQRRYRFQLTHCPGPDGGPNGLPPPKPVAEPTREEQFLVMDHMHPPEISRANDCAALLGSVVGKTNRLAALVKATKVKLTG